jgi:predicted CxxxxCH...CXXCH cytochrome family protein
MFKMTSWIKLITIAIGAAALFACGKGNSNAPILDASGKHPADWVERHWIEFRQTLPVTAKLAAKVVGATAAELATSPCTECHGADLLGGITRVSCFTAQAQNGQACHATGPVTGSHGINWESPAQHGRLGAMAAPAISAGFAYCSKCHGSTFDNGNAVSCKSCHTTAPHPPRPWFGTTASGTSHVTTNPDNASECAKCHTAGANLLGQRIGAIAPAGTAPACFNGTLCHDTSTVPHVQSAAFLTAVQHGPQAKANLSACQPCHAVPASGVNPQFNVPRNNMPVSGCEDCHKATTAHPTPWLPGRVGTPGNTANTTTHASAGNLATACALCHGAALDGSGGNGAPSCMSPSPVSGIGCHATSPAATSTGCTSCHGNPPNGTARPNIAGAHAKHLNLSNVTCQACHFGAGANAVNNIAIGTAKHADGTVDMALLDIDPASNSFKAKIGNFSLNADKTCANVRCHGGQTTPAWTTTGTITVSTDCLKCHEQGSAPQTPQFNSFFSGSIIPGINEHQSHLLKINPGTVRLVLCTDCHNIANLTNQQHFGGLATTGFTAPGSTIGGPSTRITSYEATKRCATACHDALFGPGSIVSWEPQP